MIRLSYMVSAAVICLVEIGIAGFVHDCFVRPYVGDSLAVLLVFFTIRAFTRLSIGTAIVAALAIACAFEFGQLIELKRRGVFDTGHGGAKAVACISSPTKVASDACESPLGGSFRPISE
ncbi:MAG: DUF2809 domain-containing protein [Pseudomonadota bacterium]|tara:strand:- start:198 stop:557 length:360 start_codon:yes stop_codon:yes gene_type:complete